MLMLDGESLQIASLAAAARNPEIAVGVSSAAWERVAVCRRLVDQAVQKYLSASTEAERKAAAVYGVTTGFGEFKSVLVDQQMLIKLQENILLSHSVGVGLDENPDNPANFFTADIVRAALILRVNAFLKGHSGVRPELIKRLLEMINSGTIPMVPTRGSLGSSGDLCPLAHLFATLLGHGRYITVKTSKDVARGFVHATLKDASEWPRFQLAEKEGLALTNGAVFCNAMLALAVQDARLLANTADATVALALEAIHGRMRAFDPAVHISRGLKGQITSAGNIRGLIAGSKLIGLRQDVQDAYSVRCAPQVHGASRDAIDYAANIAQLEMNAATDNPLFFPGHTPEDSGDACDPQRNHEPLAFSAGNFHGQPIGLACDFLAIAVAELANISERRTQMLLDRHHNNGLPANLVRDGGLNSGLMIAQYTAASLVSENKVLCHPASVDSIPSSANVEDHVAMATIAARKLMQVVANTRAVLAIEAVIAAQALEFLPREKLAPGTAEIYHLIRRHVEPLEQDRYLEPTLRAARVLVGSGALADVTERRCPR